MEQEYTPGSVFSSIFEKNSWGGESSISGPGSDPINTVHIIRELPRLLEKFNIRQILDIPCGDFNWFKEVPLHNIEYVGADIVKPLVDRNNIKYGTKNISFIELDLLKDVLPKVELIVCRDCLFHFPNEYIKKAISNIKASNSKYLLTTSHNWKVVENNIDIAEFGDWRRINLEVDPFNFPAPIYSIFEGSTRPADVDRFLNLWEISKI